MVKEVKGRYNIAFKQQVLQQAETVLAFKAQTQRIFSDGGKS